MSPLAWTSALLLLATTLSIYAEKQSYAGFEVIRAYAERLEDLLYLQEQEEPGKLMIWDFGPGKGRLPVSVAVYVHPDYVLAVKSELVQRDIQYDVEIADLQKEIDMEQSENEKARSKPGNTWFESYHTYEEIMEWIDNLAASPPCSGFCEAFSIGSSYEGRQLKVLKVTGAPNGCTRKRAIWIDSGIHSREWIAHTTNQYLMDRMVNEYETDPLVRQMRDTYDWYFYDIVNPDGYSFTWTDNRLWRKSRRPNPGSDCYGTDVNRNFDHMWNSIGASTNPCSETFAGAGPYSEPEARLLASYLEQPSLIGSWEFFLTLHTYGQLFMAPWGYTQSPPETYNELIRVGQAGVNGIRNTHGITYTLGSAANILYESSGTSRDWAYGVPRIPYVYTIELRNTNSFVLPPSQILPTGEEIWAGLKEVFRAIWEERPPPNCFQ